MSSHMPQQDSRHDTSDPQSPLDTWMIEFTQVSSGSRHGHGFGAGAGAGGGLGEAIGLADHGMKKVSVWL
jgi:hypothetical protein